MSNIKETMVLKSKNVDKYFNESKRLLVQQDVLEAEFKRAKKSLQANKNEIAKLNQWVKTL